MKFVVKQKQKNIDNVINLRWSKTSNHDVDNVTYDFHFPGTVYSADYIMELHPHKSISEGVVSPKVWCHKYALYPW